MHLNSTQKCKESIKFYILTPTTRSCVLSCVYKSQSISIRNGRKQYSVYAKLQIEEKNDLYNI